MSTINPYLTRTKQSDLERVIEPLASYICATEHPSAAMKSALDYLVRTVAEMNRVARCHVANREAR